jgi:hypothetical protein
VDATAMLETHPTGPDLDAGLLARAIEATAACAQTCSACADACLGEDGVADLRHCITTDLNCADVCAATSRVLSRQTAYDGGMTRAIVEACAEVCRRCAEECERHAEMGMDHCRTCAEACRRCEAVCREVLEAIGAA